MDIHLKKLNEIKRANTVKRVDDTKKVDEYLNRRHIDKMRTAEFEKQGKILDFSFYREGHGGQQREQETPRETCRDIKRKACKRSNQTHSSSSSLWSH